jgi:hypothetical protein
LNLIRDDLSRDFLLRLGVPHDRLVLTRDVSFGEDFTTVANPRFDVGVNIRCGFNGRVNFEVLRAFLNEVRRARPGLQVLVYSTTHQPGEEVSNAVHGLADVEPNLPQWAECLHLPAACRVNISDSYHGAIFSMMANRPVICCQTDYATWKMQGMRTPYIPAIEMLPGFVSHDEIATLLSRTLAMLDNPAPVIAEQTRRVGHARTLCAQGWQTLWTALRTMNSRSLASCA